MKNTSNYLLPQFEYNDVFNKEDINKAFLDIDSGMNALQSTVNGVVSGGAETILEVANARSTFDTLNDRLDYFHNHISDMSINIKDFGFVGDGVFDNTNKMIDLINNLDDGTTIYVPKGDFLFKLDDNLLQETGNGGTMFWIKNKTNIRLTGIGSLLVDSSNVHSKNWFMQFSDCKDIIIDGIKIIGDTEFHIGQILSSNRPNGIVFEHCERVILTQSHIKNIMCCTSSTGSVSSPASTNYVGYDTVIFNNVFENYGQNSTYGGGASRYMFSNNICINSLQNGLKLSSNPLMNEETLNNSYDNVIMNNIITWTKDFQFPNPDWDAEKSFSPVGLMIQCHSRNVLVQNNIVNMENISQTFSNPVQAIGCLVLHKRSALDDVDYAYKNVDIRNNQFLAMSTYNSLLISPHALNINIVDNTLKGKVEFITSETLTIMQNSLNFSDNTMLSTPELYNYLAIKALYKNVTIDGNKFYSDTGTTYKTFIEFGGATGDYLTITNNVLNNGQIVDYSTGLTDYKYITIKNNILSNVTLHTTSNTVDVTLSNDIQSSSTAYNITTGSDTTLLSVAGNTGKCTVMINVDKGKIRLDGNGVHTSSSTPYVLGTCLVMSGELSGDGVPSFVANAGVGYNDLSVISNAYYIKTKNGDSDGWKQII